MVYIDEKVVVLLLSLRLERKALKTPNWDRKEGVPEVVVSLRSETLIRRNEECAPRHDASA